MKRIPFLFSFFYVLQMLAIKIQSTQVLLQSNTILDTSRNYFLKGKENSILSRAENLYKIVKKQSVNSYRMYMIANYTGASKYFVFTNNEIAKTLNITITYESKNILDVIIKNHEYEEYEIPYQDPFPYLDELEYKDKDFSESDLEYRIDIFDEPFSFQLVRKASEEVIFDTSNYNFILSRKYIEFESYKPTENIFGMGERNFNFRLKNGTYTLWARDEVADVEIGEPGHNSYGVHPMYLMQEKSGNYHVCYLRSSSALDFSISNDSINFKIVGGIIHLKYFLGDKSPETAIIKYHRYIKGFIIPPFWSMGFHHSKWGFKSTKHLKQAVDAYRNKDIPIDAIWMDIDYMQKYLVFSANSTQFSYGSLKKLKKETGIRIVPIVDAAIGQAEYKPYWSLMINKNYISNAYGNAFIGRVWSGDSIYPDFFHPMTQNYWTEMLNDLSDLVPFDGIWLDMNEATNFCDGPCYSPILKLNDMSMESIIEAIKLQGEKILPYTPGNRSLETKSIDITAVHYDDYFELEVHSLFGILHSFQTYNALKNDMKIKMPFILSRSTFPGSGRYSFHWTGDNNSTWEFLKLSIPAMFNFGIFGIPMVGSDLCGFYGNTTEELCARWIQVGSLYPFSRNHKHIDFLDQSFYNFSDLIINVAQKSFKFRYSILKYYYSLFLEKKMYGTIIKPIFFEFPGEFSAFQQPFIDEQFMIGKDLMVVPILEERTTFRLGFFPSSVDWYCLKTGKIVSIRNDKNELLIQNALHDIIPIFAREGSIIFRQNPETILSTENLKNNVFDLLVFLSKFEKEGHQSSYGKISIIQDLNNESLVTSQCLSSELDCIITLRLSLIQKNPSDTLIQISTSNASLIDPSFHFNIDNIRISGVNYKELSWSSNIQKYCTLQSFGMKATHNFEQTCYAFSSRAIDDHINIFINLEKLKLEYGQKLVLKLSHSNQLEKNEDLYQNTYSVLLGCIGTILVVHNFIKFINL